MDRKPILCLDFDGVIHSYKSGWQGGTTIIPDPYVPGFFKWAIEAVKHFKLVVYSSRSKDLDAPRAMREWLGTQSINAIEAGEVSSDFDWGSLFPYIEFAHEKPPAFLTIDDRAWCFDGTWPDPKRLLAFKTWQQKTLEASKPGYHVAWVELPNGDVNISMTSDDWQNLLFTLGYAGGAAMKEKDRVLLYQQMALLNRLNVGNPHFTPYEIPNEATDANGRVWDMTVDKDGVRWEAREPK